VNSYPVLGQLDGDRGTERGEGCEGPGEGNEKGARKR
jgi:hypothetical protein